MSDDQLLRALPRDVPDYHARQAGHLRALAENATTPRLKNRLLDEAERHERLVIDEDEPHKQARSSALSIEPAQPVSFAIDAGKCVPLADRRKVRMNARHDRQQHLLLRHHLSRHCRCISRQLHLADGLFS